MNPQIAQFVLQQFSAFLWTHREAITEAWLAAVRADGNLLAPERLTAEQLRQHLPSLFSHLANLLCFPADRDAAQQANENARDHGRLRFGQGYRLNELLRELSRLRGTLLVYTLRYEDENPDFTGMAKRVALQRLHGFLDDVIRDAVTQFVGDQSSGLRDRARLAADARDEARKAGGRAENQRQEALREYDDLVETQAVASQEIAIVLTRLQAAISESLRVADGPAQAGAASRLAISLRQVEEEVAQLSKQLVER